MADLSESYSLVLILMSISLTEEPTEIFSTLLPSKTVSYVLMRHFCIPLSECPTEWKVIHGVDISAVDRTSVWSS